jgi:hypothetical protein
MPSKKNRPKSVTSAFKAVRNPGRLGSKVDLKQSKQRYINKYNAATMDLEDEEEEEEEQTTSKKKMSSHQLEFDQKLKTLQERARQKGGGRNNANARQQQILKNAIKQQQSKRMILPAPATFQLPSSPTSTLGIVSSSSPSLSNSKPTADFQFIDSLINEEEEEEKRNMIRREKEEQALSELSRSNLNRFEALEEFEVDIAPATFVLPS